MRKNLDNVAYLRHIIDAIEKICNYSEKYDYTYFSEHEWDQSALIRYLTLIGEAASQIEESYRIKYSKIPWRKIINLRNILIHDYMDIDIQVMWSIIINDIPPLRKEINLILSQ